MERVAKQVGFYTEQCPQTRIVCAHELAGEFSGLDFYEDLFDILDFKRERHSVTVLGVVCIIEAIELLSKPKLARIGISSLFDLPFISSVCTTR